MQINEVTTDVLIIGGAHAALRAAIEAAQKGVKVTVVDKSKVGRSSISSGDTGGSFGSIRIPPDMGGDPNEPEDSVQADSVSAGEYLNRQDLLEIFARESLDRFKDLVRWGVTFLKRPDGHYQGRINMGESFPRGFSLKYGPDVLFDGMMREVSRLGITCYEQVMVTRLLTKDGRVAGAFGLQRESGEYFVFKAKATVLGAGGMTNLLKHTSAYHPATGDSFALAYEAGAELFNMEFIGYSLIPTPLGISIPLGGTLPMTAGGARFYNAMGERIMEKYDPEKLELCEEWKMSYANYKERKEGLGPVYIDVSCMQKPNKGLIDKVKLTTGIDASKERVEMSVSTRTSPGGVWINEKARTTVPGLYAAGDASGEAGIRGAGGRAGGFTNAQVFGQRAGKYAAEEALNSSLLEPEKEQVSRETSKIEAFKKNKGRSPYDVARKLREFSYENLNIIRNEQGIERAISYFTDLRHQVAPLVSASNLPELVKALEVNNLALAGEMTARSSQLRTESRGFFQREDFPHRNDREWLKWIILGKNKKGEINLSVKPIPIERYPLKPPSISLNSQL